MRRRSVFYERVEFGGSDGDQNLWRLHCYDDVLIL